MLKLLFELVKALLTTCAILFTKLLKFGAFFIACLLVFNVMYAPALEFDEIGYSDFLKNVRTGEYEKIVINTSQNNALLYAKETGEKYKIKFVSAEEVESIILKEIDNGQALTYEVSDVKKPSWFIAVCATGMLTSLLVFWATMLERVFGISKPRTHKNKDKDSEEKQKAKLIQIRSVIGDNTFVPEPITPDKMTVRFSNVIGLDKQIEEMKDIVSFLKMPEKYKERGAVVPRGILLYGKPGTGKTLIAKAIAGEAKVPFFQLSASELLNKYVGGSEENVRKLFEEANKVAPAIVFIDEIDSIAMQRYSENSNRYSASLLNQILACMDGFEDNSGVIVIAATNYIDVLDNAILRRGRFDRKIYIQEPDISARRDLITYYLKGKNYNHHSEFLMKLPSITHGFTGADFKTLLNEAAILSVRDRSPFIENKHFAEAYRKLLVGSKKSNAQETWETQQLTAVHEAGHAIVANALGKTPHEISIISRGSAGGYNLFGEDDKPYERVEDILNEVTICLAGRAAEKYALKKISSGASNDLKNASELLRRMHLVYGMGPNKNIGIVLTGNEKIDTRITNDAIAAIEQDLNDCFQKAFDILKKNEEQLRNLVELLMERETLTGFDVEYFFKG